MYNISAEELELFRRCYRQTARIKVFGVTGLTDITDADILMNGLTIDRYCFSSGTLEIGTAIASELSLALDNHTGKFNDYDFDGATLSVSIGIKKWDAKAWEKAVIHYVPVGIFTVDEKSKNTSTIVLNALDNMVRFDKSYDTDLSYPATLADILQDACTKCGVSQYTTDFPNASYEVAERPSSENLTYRQIVQWVAELAAANAWIDWNGSLRLNWFEATDLTISGADRYSSDEAEYAVTITGVRVSISDDDTALAGENGCVLNIEGNDLAQSGAAGIAENIYEKVGGFAYLPYSCTTRPAPFLFPLDRITYIDNEHKTHSTIVSAMTYVLNGVTTVSGEGIGETQASYAPTGGTTKQEKIIIEKVKKDLEKDNTEKYSTLLHLNQIISGAFGLYQTEIEDNGVKTFYFHDKPTLAGSTIIYVFNAGGFAWTDDWNNGQPVWKYGFTQDGNAVYHILSAYKIQAKYIEAGSITADKISQAYKSSVNKAISEGDASVTQAFISADGVLRSEITAEIERAQGVEESLSTRITATASDVTIEANRALNAEKSLSSRITANATSISAKVSSTGGSKYSFGWSLTSSGFVLTASSTEVMKVTSSGLNVTGTITATGGNFSNCVIDETCTVKGTLIADTICNNESDRATGKIFFSGSSTEAFYEMLIADKEDTGKMAYMRLVDNAKKPSIFLAVQSQKGSAAASLVLDESTLTVEAICKLGDKHFSNDLVGTWYCNGSVINSSDRNVKNSIADIGEKYDALFDGLRARLYKYNNGTSGRLHSGFIAQEVKEALQSANISTADFAAFCAENVGTDTERLGLRYEEFISLNTWQIQKLKARVAELERKIYQNERENNACSSADS